MSGKSPNPSSSQRSGYRKKSWEEMFEELKAYKEEHGDISMKNPSDFVHNLRLGRWTEYQRTYYRKFKNGSKSKRLCRGMCQDRINLMEGIGFKWSTNRLIAIDGLDTDFIGGTDTIGSSDTINSTNNVTTISSAPSNSTKASTTIFDSPVSESTRISIARSPKASTAKSESSVSEITGNTITPKASTTANASPTGATTRTTRSPKPSTTASASPAIATTRTTRSSKVGIANISNDAKHNIAQPLKAVGEHVVRGDNHQNDNDRTNDDLSNNQQHIVQESDEWESKMKQLHEFKRIHGHVDVPRRYRPDARLGKWVDCQRSGYKKYKSSQRKGKNGMNEYRIMRLKAIGFKWSLKGLKPRPLANEGMYLCIQ